MALEFPYTPTTVANGVDFYLASHHNRQGSQISELTNRVNRFWADDAGRPTPTVDPDFSDIYPLGLNVTRATYEFWNGAAWIQIPLSVALSFLQLTDTPSDYTGQGGNVLKVKGAEDGLEFGSVGGAGFGDLLEERVLSSDVSPIVFTSISQAYRHLILVRSLRSTESVGEDDEDLVQFNGDTNPVYDWLFRRWFGNNFSTSSGGVAETSARLAYLDNANGLTNSFSFSITWFFNYSRTDMHKWFRSNSASFGNSSVNTDLIGLIHTGRYRSNSAITSISTVPTVGPDYEAGGVLQLYGSQ